MKKVLIGIIFAGLSVVASANPIDNAKVSNVYIQSQDHSGAHAIRIDKEIDESCSGRMHIEFSDKELFSAVLAYQLSNKEFSIMYLTGMPGKNISGHLISTCKVKSVY